MKKLYILSVFLFLFLNSSSQISAHPLDEIGNIKLYDQTQTLEIKPDSTKLTIDLKFYSVEKIKVWESIDLDRDQKLTEEEKNIWMNKGSDASWLEIDGKRYDFEAKELTFPDYYDFFSPAPAKVAIAFISKVPVKPGMHVIYHYKGKDKPLEEITFKATGANGLSVQNLSKIDATSSSFTLSEGAQGNGSIQALKTSNRLNNFLNTYVKVDKIPTGLAIFALVIAFLIGMLHALTPGHGKAIVAGYLVGEKGTVKHAIQLGIIITITHTSSVFIIGLLSLLLTEYIVPATVIKWMNTTSGILIVGFGIYLLVTRLLKLGNSDKSHSHHHMHDNGHLHAHEHLHDEPLMELTWKNLLPLGISGGIVPCVDALAILIVAVSLQKILFGLGLLIFFSLGLAVALVTGGIIVVTTKNKVLEKIPALESGSKYVSVVSAVIVTILGVAILMNKPI